MTPAENAIYDAKGNAASTTQSNNTANLKDKTVPTVSSVTTASDNKTIVQLGIFDEALQSAGETGSRPGAWCEMSGLYPTSISYNFPLDDNFSEDITLVGNTKIWGTGQTTSILSCAASYYPSGVSGQFSKGDHIKILDKNFKEFAIGLSSFSSNEINIIKGHQSSDIHRLLGYISKSEVVHKDDMVEI